MKCQAIKCRLAYIKPCKGVCASVHVWCGVVYMLVVRWKGACYIPSAVGGAVWYAVNVSDAALYCRYSVLLGGTG